MERLEAPDVFVIVMDSVGASHAASILADDSEETPELRILRDEFTTFRRAATVAPWTLPAHKALLTGRYHWEQEDEAFTARSASTARTIPGVLRAAGYYSVCLASNAFLAPRFGLTREFDHVAWGGPWEPFLRYRSVRSPTIWCRGAHSGDPSSAASSSKSSDTWAQVVPRIGLRFPRCLRLVNSAAAHITAQSGSLVPVSPWIEEVFGNLLSKAEPNTPIFGLINLMDAHDPYLTPGENGHGKGYWSVPQDPLYFMSRRLPASDSRVAALRSAYRVAVRQALVRVSNLLRMIDSSRDRRSRFVVVTSDHGQAFMEDGILFHGFSVDDAVTRIPFLVQWPAGASPGSGDDDWVSLVDIAPTIYKLAGVQSAASSCSGRVLGAGPHQPRENVVYALTTGIHNRRAARLVLSDSLYRRLNRVQVAGYSGRWKVTHDLSSGRIHRVRYAEDPADGQASYPEPAIDLSSVQDSLGSIANQLRDSTASIDDSVRDRLATWGYV